MSREVLAEAGVVCAVGVMDFAVAAYSASPGPIPINNAECTIYPTDGSPTQKGYCTGTVDVDPAGLSQAESSQLNTNPVTSPRSYPWNVVAPGVILVIALYVITIRSRKRPKFPRRKHLRSTHQG